MEKLVRTNTYNYDQRYFLEMNGAYNGSERFGPLYRFEFFPSVGGGWMISNEKFFRDRFEWIDQLKFRYSYGLVGNDRVNTGSTWPRSEEHTSELQSLMRISYAVFCLKKKKKKQ